MKACTVRVRFGWASHIVIMGQKAVEEVQRVAPTALLHGACARSDKERRRGVATLRRGGETPDQPHNRHVPTDMYDMTLHVEGLGWHGPISVVGAPNRSYSYGVVAPPRIWGRGIPNAAHCTPSTAF